MSPDDEPQIQTGKPNKNNLINEAFNLNSNFTGIQPLKVLPPSDNHFQPISGHSRTPSIEIRDLKLNALKPPPVNLFQGNNQSKTPNSFFDQTNITQNILAAPAPPVVSKTPTELVRNPSPALNNLKSTIPTSNNSPLASNTMAPPIPPPASIPPPATSANSGTSNPYSAKGALNKKVYDNIVNTAPINQPPSFMTSPQAQVPFTSAPGLDNTKSPQAASNMFVPPQPVPSQMPPSQSYQQFQSQPPINSNTLTSSISVNNNFPTSNNYNNNGYQQQQQQYNQPQAQNGQNGMWNWFSQNKLVNTFVEKAKIGVESFVSTVDPQMQNYNHPANKSIYLLSSTTTPKVVQTIRDAFNNVGFSKIAINSIDAPNSSQFAPQVVGYPCALQSVREKMDNSLATMQDNECTIVAIQDFLAEITTDCWFELAVIMLKDKRKNIELTVYTEALPVSNEDIAQLQQYTSNDFNLKWSGYSVRLPEKNFNFNANNAGYPTPFLSYDTPDTMLSSERLSHALKSLATLFKNKMIAQMN